MADTTQRKTLSLRESAASDASKGLAGKLTGWGLVSKQRTGEQSTSQRRKRNRKAR